MHQRPHVSKRGFACLHEYTLRLGNEFIADFNILTLAFQENFGKFKYTEWSMGFNYGMLNHKDFITCLLIQSSLDTA